MYRKGPHSFWPERCTVRAFRQILQNGSFIKGQARPDAELISELDSVNGRTLENAV